MTYSIQVSEQYKKQQHQEKNIKATTQPPTNSRQVAKISNKMYSIEDPEMTKICKERNEQDHQSNS